MDRDIQPDPPVITFTLESVEWHPETGVLDFEVLVYEDKENYETKRFSISPGPGLWDKTDYFSRILPNMEYNSIQEDGIYMAMLDGHFNLHWLVKDYKGRIHYSVIYLKPILESIAEEKS